MGASGYHLAVITSFHRGYRFSGRTGRFNFWGDQTDGYFTQLFCDSPDVRDDNICQNKEPE
jgi:hypothetical protein